MTKEGLEFAFWAVLIVGAATGLILYQHSLHAQAIAGALTDASAHAQPTQSAPFSTATGSIPPVAVGTFPDLLSPGYPPIWYDQSLDAVHLPVEQIQGEGFAQ